MKIAILGTRGIPNHYGGFEQFSEYLSLGLVGDGHEVYVYNSHTHPFQQNIWNGVNIIHKYDPEYKVGTAGQFIYDLNCILDSRKRNFDIILQLGYTSSAVWGKLLPKHSIIVTNMDGLEWKRTKYSKKVQKLIYYFENLAIKNSHFLIADSIGIQNYLKTAYNASSVYIPYGATVFSSPSMEYLQMYGMEPYNYDMLIARLEPENNIDTILNGIVNSAVERPFLVVGNYKTKYGIFLREKYKKFNFIKFLGPLYDITSLNNLRYYSNLYFHGHTVGGTNPSLLEAMASSALICAHKNTFNSSILGEDAYYFENYADIIVIHQKVRKHKTNLEMIKRNKEKIISTFSWNNINSQYLGLFKRVIKTKG